MIARMPPVLASIHAGRSTTRVDRGDRRLVEPGQLGDVAGGLRVAWYSSPTTSSASAATPTAAAG